MKTTWKYLNEKTGTTQISLPANFTELLIYVYQKDSDASYGTNWVVHKDMILNTKSIFLSGFNNGFNNYFGVTITVSKASLLYFTQNGTNYLNNAKCRIYYK